MAEKLVRIAYANHVVEFDMEQFGDKPCLRLALEHILAASRMEFAEPAAYQQWVRQMALAGLHNDRQAIDRMALQRNLQVWETIAKQYREGSLRYAGVITEGRATDSDRDGRGCDAALDQ
jgi:hypothetical protein